MTCCNPKDSLPDQLQILAWRPWPAMAFTACILARVRSRRTSWMKKNYFCDTWVPCLIKWDYLWPHRLYLSLKYSSRSLPKISEFCCSVCCTLAPSWEHFTQGGWRLQQSCIWLGLFRIGSASWLHTNPWWRYVEVFMRSFSSNSFDQLWSALQSQPREQVLAQCRRSCPWTSHLVSWHLESLTRLNQSEPTLKKGHKSAPRCTKYFAVYTMIPFVEFEWCVLISCHGSIHMRSSVSCHGCSDVSCWDHAGGRCPVGTCPQQAQCQKLAVRPAIAATVRFFHRCKDHTSTVGGKKDRNGFCLASLREFQQMPSSEETFDSINIYIYEFVQKRDIPTTKWLFYREKA